MARQIQASNRCLENKNALMNLVSSYQKLRECPIATHLPEYHFDCCKGEAVDGAVSQLCRLKCPQRFFAADSPHIAHCAQYFEHARMQVSAKNHNPSRSH